MSVVVEKSANATAIRPFAFDSADADLEDLRARIEPGVEAYAFTFG